MSFGRIEVSGGAFLVIALLYYFDRSGVFGWVLAAGLLHEMGHLAAIRCMGEHIKYLRLSCVGAELRLSAAKTLSAGQMAVAALAGPGVNFLLALGSVRLASHGMGEKLYLFAGINLGLALFNLLPVNWLDGGRVLENLMIWLGMDEFGKAAVDISSKVVLALLLLGGLLLFWQSEGRNFTLLLPDFGWWEPHIRKAM